MLLLFGSIMILLGAQETEKMIITTIIILCLVIFCSVAQLIIYFSTLKHLLINEDGIIIFSKSNVQKLVWDDVKLFTYYSEVVILEPNTLKIVYNDNKLLLSKNYSNIHVSLKKYKMLIKFIPPQILENNHLFLYETEYLYNNDKYKLLINSQEPDSKLDN